MPIEKSGGAVDLTFVAHAAGSLAAYQYFGVYSTGVCSNGLPYVTLCAQTSNATGRMLGVLQNDPIASAPAIVRVSGITKMATVTAITAGALVGCSTGGCAFTVTSSAHYIIGVALSTTASTSGELIDVLLQPGGSLN
jgi:hypothetical protein